MWIVPAGLAVLALGVFGLLKVTGAGPGGGRAASATPTQGVPSFRFAVTRAVPLSTTSTKRESLASLANQAASEITTIITRLYTEAFLDPANWRAGSYANVWPLFDSGAGAAARKDVQALTAGTDAGSRFVAVEPVAGTLVIRVLMDESDRPSIAVAIVTFSADATATAGGLTTLVSSAQFILHETPNGWRIYSFSVQRRDRPGVPSPGPSSTQAAP